MKHPTSSLIAAIVCLLLLLPMLPQAAAAETQEAANITQACSPSAEGFSEPKKLFDGKTGAYQRSGDNARISLVHSEGIGSLYLMFDLEYGAYTITDTETGTVFTAGTQGFLHEYIDLSAAFGYAPKSVVIEFANGAVSISEVYAFSPGTPPDYVQVWNAPLDGGADLVLFSTHSDDDQLFFAGLLPYYAVERGYRVQVVYLTNHRNMTNLRIHEMLNGLWTVGITAYPVFGDFDDFRIDDMDRTYKEYQRRGTTREALLGFVVEQVRRFKPLVAVGHDLKGEYQHGMHMVYADLLCEAVQIGNDPEKYPESAAAYGVWDTPKTYLHLYSENKIVMDFDQPMEAFDGLTPFQVSQKLGFPCHKSQQYAWLVEWINGKNKEITKASQIELFNPSHYGLFRSTVGEDASKNDMFENLTDYAEQERIEEEKRLEEERKKQEEEQRRKEEEERKRQEEAARLEAERLALEQAAAEAAAAKAKQEQLVSVVLTCCLCAAGILIAVIIVLSILRHRKKNKS